MTDQCRANHTSAKPYRTLLTRSAGWIGGMGVLSGGMLWAQTVPTPVPVASPAPTAIDITPVEVAPVPSLAVESTPAPPTTMALPAVPVSESSPASALESPNVTISTPAPAASQTRSEPGNAYIDATQYNVGATDYEAPASIVLSERSTGCQRVLRGGQGVAGVCAPEAPRPSTAWSARPADPTWVNRQAPAIRVGPLSIGTNGIQVGPSPYALYYYNQTSRPQGLLSNGNLSLLFPLSIPTPITSLFGWRTHPITGDLRFHSGVDLGAPAGTPVVAAYAGQVTVADFMGGYGLAVVIDHNKSTQETLYGHLSEIFVQSGEWVEQGTVIGRVGSTGNSTGPHLHFEFRQLTPNGWVALDPGQQLQQALAQLTNPLPFAQGQFKREDVISFSVGLTLESAFPVAQVPTPTGQAARSGLNPRGQATVFGLESQNQIQ